MDLTPDPKVDMEGAIDITLAGKVFKIPHLPLRQVMALGPAIDARNDVVNGLSGRYPQGQELVPYATIIQIGLSVAYRFTIEDILSMAISQIEVATATNAIINQSQHFRVLEPGEAEAMSRSPG